MLIVQKYGGATLATPQHIKNVAQRIAHLKKSGTQVVAVVSAMGQTTNELIKLAHQVTESPSLRELDMLLSVGERTSMALVTMALNDLKCAAISFTGSQAGILTDESHINANIIDVKAFRVSEALSNNKVVILAGFQGVSPVTKEITTLGRGGTDTTAVAMAAYLKADRCEILKDVDGVYSADPKIVSQADPIQKLNYDQLLEMTMWGAKVLNFKSVALAKEKNVTIYVGPASDHLSDGTLVTGENPYPNNQPLAVSTYAQVFQMGWKDCARANEHLEPALKKDLHLNQIGEPQFLKSINTDSGKNYIAGPTEILAAIQNHAQDHPLFHLQNKDLCSVSLTFSQSPTLQIQQQIHQQFQKEKIYIHEEMTTLLNLNYILNMTDKNKALQILHSFIG